MTLPEQIPVLSLLNLLTAEEFPLRKGISGNLGWISRGSPEKIANSL
jgi:hypothetical protein